MNSGHLFYDAKQQQMWEKLIWLINYNFRWMAFEREVQMGKP